jgi:hypothetical protein
MAPSTNIHTKLSNPTRQHLPLPTHFTPTSRTPSCDHCTYFKGTVYRSLHPPTDPDQLLLTRHNNLAQGPRSLLNIALLEEAIEAREHNKYMAWSRSLHAAAEVEAAAVKEAEKAAQKQGVYARPSDTLTGWIEGSTKEELLAWLERNGDSKDDMEVLRFEGIFDLREYILHRRRGQRETLSAKKVIIAEQKVMKEGKKKGDPHRDVTAQRLRDHTSVKPPQAALREREELARWYDSKKAPELKDEIRLRGIRPVPGRKADMVVVLVEDDKKRA